MKSILKDYDSEFKKDLNVPLMTKSNDGSLVDFVMDAFKSLEVFQGIKIVGYDYSEKESDIDMNKFIFKREKGKKKNEKFDYKNIDDDRYGKLTVHIEAHVFEDDPEHPGKRVKKIYPFHKTILIPLQDEDGYFYIKGKKYYLIYQLVEKSTYTNAQCVVQKSLMPVSVKRDPISCTDINGKEYVLPYYSVFVFRKPIPVLLFYLSKGIKYTMTYLDVENVIEFLPSEPTNLDNDKFICFPMSQKCWMKVRKKAFMEHPYIQSVVGGFMNISTNRISLSLLDDSKTWIKKIADPPNYEKGLQVLRHFNRLMDITTAKSLKVNPYHKQDVYALVRWLCEEYNELRQKDNCDLDNKRLRCNEHISSLLTQDFSYRLTTLLKLGDKATIEVIKDKFKFPADILLQKMHSSGILRYTDTVNDMDFFNKFKYTTKGKHSLGGNNSNNISMKYRALHPSFLSRIDCLVCGNSDPGTSGVLSPFSNIEGFYFNNSNEPENFSYQLNKELEKVIEDEGKTFINITCDNPDDYYNILMQVTNFDNSIKCSGTSRTDKYDIIVSKDESLDLGDREEEKKKREEKYKKAKS